MSVFAVRHFKNNFYNMKNILKLSYDSETFTFPSV